MKHKILGYLFICIGIFLMFFATVSMYKVFVGHQPVVAVVQLADVSMQSQFGTMLVPMANFNVIINLGFFVLFMLFVVIVGGEVALLGCNFLKIERLYEALAQQQETLSKEQLKKL